MASGQSRNRRKLIIFSVIGAVLVGMTLLAVFRKRQPVITVQTEKATRRDLTEVVVANGRIQPVVQVKISAEVSGEIIELPVKEGQAVKKGDLLVKIKPDLYLANRKSAEAGYLSSQAGQTLAEASLRKAELEFLRNEGLFKSRLISESTYLEFKTAFDIGRAQLESARHQVDVAKASLARVEEELAKTTIYSPLTGTVSKLNSELGERVVGTAMMSGTEIMIVADLNEMEARVDIGEIDIVLIKLGQNARLEVDAFRDRKFKGTVTEIANSSKGAALPGGGGGQSQEATKFEVKIRVNEKEQFRPGMSVNAEIETRSRTNVLTVPIQSVTTRLPKEAKGGKSASTNAVEVAEHRSGSDQRTDASSGGGTRTNKTDRKPDESPKPIEVVFVVEGDHVKMAPVKRGIADDTYVELTEGLEEGQDVVSGGYKAISRELEDGKKVRKGKPEAEKEQEKK